MIYIYNFTSNTLIKIKPNYIVCTCRYRITHPLKSHITLQGMHSVADLEKNKGGGVDGLESTGPWSNGLRSLNPKCHYEYQEMRVGGGGGGG